MKILHINTLLNGGAAIAVKRLHQGLVDSGVNSTVFYKNGFSDDLSYIKWEGFRQNSLIHKIKRKLNLRTFIQRREIRKEKSYFLDKRPEGFELFSPIRLDQKIRFHDLPIRPDIIHLHWIAGFFNYKEFFESIPVDVPIVWTLHDMNAFTGGCHYSLDCDGYTNTCGNCPQLAHANEKDLSNKVIEEKLRLLSERLIYVVADSYWIESLAKKSSLFRNVASIRTIHYGLEVDILTPKDKDSCKRAFGISPNNKVIVFGADNVNNKRKGLAELTAAIEILKKKNENIFLLTFGKNSGLSTSSNTMTKHLGFISSLDILSIIYSAADVFVMPSLFEAFGQVSLEAMSCGVPVVSFNNGGASDTVIDGVTGYLARKGDSIDLAEKLTAILCDDVIGRDMGLNARDLVLKQFTINTQALTYKNLYEEVYCLAQ